MILTDTSGQTNLPRYFTQVFATSKKINHGRLDFILPDGRIFRAEGSEPGPVGVLEVHNPDSLCEAGARRRSGVLRCLS